MVRTWLPGWKLFPLTKRRPNFRRLSCLLLFFPQKEKRRDELAVDQYSDRDKAHLRPISSIAHCRGVNADRRNLSPRIVLADRGVTVDV